MATELQLSPMTPAPQSDAKPPRRWYQFSVRTLLIGTAVVAVGLAILDWRWIGPARRQCAAVEKIKECGGSCRYAYTGSRLIRYLANWLPPDYLGEIQEVKLYADNDLINLKGLPALKYISLYGKNVTDAGLRHLNGYPTLDSLSLDSTQVTDAGLAQIQGLKNLIYLDLSYTQVTDSGLVHLVELRALEILTLDGTRVTDAGLVQLKQLTSLKFLSIRYARVTAAGADEFQQSLPQCQCRTFP